ncbi:MAG: hypothetical protein RLZZ350_1078 [Verrucomicrobiota bacterium]|jgi:uncharacterized protein YhhL (DUF1145 family)
MNPFAKAARLLLRLVAVGLILICGLNVTLELLRHRAQHVEINRLKIILNAQLFFDGILLLIFSGKLADKLAQRLDE